MERKVPLSLHEIYGVRSDLLKHFAKELSLAPACFFALHTAVAARQIQVNGLTDTPHSRCRSRGCGANLFCILFHLFLSWCCCYCRFGAVWCGSAAKRNPSGWGTELSVSFVPRFRADDNEHKSIAGCCCCGAVEGRVLHFIRRGDNGSFTKFNEVAMRGRKTAMWYRFRNELGSLWGLFEIGEGFAGRLRKPCCVVTRRSGAGL